MIADNVILKAIGLRLGYGKHTILDNVNMEIKKGDFWVLLGPNGEGKSTLLKAILGEIKPLKGKLLTHRKFIRRNRIGFVPQRCNFNPTLPTTIREFVSLGFVGLRTTKQKRDKRLSSALNNVGLHGMITKDYWSLSGGQRQRALVARALVRRPDFLILDEPITGLDLSAEYALLKTLADLNKTRHLTILFVSHDLNIAVRYASHIAMLHKGCVKAGEYGSVINSENLTNTYGVPVDIFKEDSGAITVRVGNDKNGRKT